MALAEKTQIDSYTIDTQKLDLDKMVASEKRLLTQMKFDEMQMTNTKNLYDMQQAMARMTMGKKYTFVFNKHGTTLTMSNEPCDVYNRQKFDRIWVTDDNYDATTPFTEKARHLMSLNVLTNPEDFRDYIYKLTKSTAGRSGGANSARHETADPQKPWQNVWC